ncbi:Aste57867_14746 [Aphanomyces stellatus]|uniref:Aste57867_14746 protein n=1 Tax=Aphanomyces stellatus TaxID=120398 RepID=A0A485L1H8_9STRA|nr:hypothetical protein As57867_014691 [Aphanomyces stellatus]VFT91564.1 Aste57867_14746 [Aphanomyces stellatus]
MANSMRRWCNATSSLALVDYVRDHHPHGHTYVKPASWFVSHAWGYDFLDVVDALEHFMQDADASSTAVWFCMFNNNQHDVKSGEWPFAHWHARFQGALVAIKRVVMVFSPWNDPAALQRTWYVFEVLVAIETNACFRVAMSKTQEGSFLRDADRPTIFLSTCVGFAHVDRLVFQVLEAWVEGMVNHQIDVAPTREAQIQWRLVQQGKMDDSEAGVCLN